MNDIEVIKSKSEFGPNLEKAIISLALDQPEFFELVNRYLNIEYFKDKCAKFAYAIISKYIEKYGFIPSRAIVRDAALKNLTVDSKYEDFLAVIDNSINPRDVPIIKGELLDWARDQAYGKIYSADALSAYEDRKYDKLETIIEEASKVKDFGHIGFKFFDRYEEIFIRETISHFTTGFPTLDKYINDGGPSRKEVFCWLAATGVGKSVALVNAGVANILKGHNVLHLTFEMTEEQTSVRYAGCFTNLNMNKRFEESEQTKFKSSLAKTKVSERGELIIHAFSPNEATVDNIYALLDNLRQYENFAPDIIILDYLELINSRYKDNNTDEYKKQKAVAVEVRALAFKANALVLTATQTNRGGTDPKEGNKDLDLDKVADSYGKTMALEYIVSLQQSKIEYGMAIPEVSLYIAKNRNGAKFKKITAQVKYDSSKMMEKSDVAV